MARTISAQAVINWIRLKLQGSAPASPAAGYGYLYSKTSNKHLFWKDEDGTETDLMDVTAASTTTLTGKTVNLSDNTLTGTTAQFNTALSDANFATQAGTETLTNKTVNLANNTVTGTTAEFNTALSDGNFATLAGSETLTNKTLTAPTIADFTNMAHDHGDADDGGTALASPTITTPTISGAITFPDNVTQTFNPGADNAGLNVGSIAGDPATPDNGDVWYDSTANELTARINGSNVALGAGGASVDDTAYDESTWNGVTTIAPSKNAVRDKIESLVLGSSDSFRTIAVSGQSDVVADSSTDTLTLVAGSNITITTNAGADSITFASSGGGTLIKSYWEPDLPPSSPTSQDDEFADGSLDVKWTELDHDTKLTVTESSTYKDIIFSAATHTDDTVCGLVQAIPAGDFTITTKVIVRSHGADYLYAGLALWENLLNTSDIMTLGVRLGNVSYSLFSHTWTDRNTPTAVWNTTLNPYGQRMYLRIRRNGSNYRHDMSYDGHSWQTRNVNHNPPFTPGYMGIFINNANSSLVGEASFNFFRYVASDIGFNGRLTGQVAGIYQ